MVDRFHGQIFKCACFKKKKNLVNEEPAIRISSIVLGQYSEDNTQYFFPFFFFRKSGMIQAE